MSKRLDIWIDVEKVTNIISQSISVKEALDKLERPINSSSYRQIKRFAETHNITLPSFTSEKRSELSIKNSRVRLPDSEIFKENSSANRASVKRRALALRLLEYKCYGEVCSIDQLSIKSWNGLVLQLEHKNGVGDDNRIENLELLCANCHSLTTTYGSGNRIRYENGAHGTCETCKRSSKTKVCYHCKPQKRETTASYSLESLVDNIAKTSFDDVAKKFNISVSELQRILQKKHEHIINVIGEYNPDPKKKVDYPAIEILVDRVINEGYTRVARDLKVTDTGLRKHMKKVLNGNLPEAKYGSRKK